MARIVVDHIENGLRTAREAAGLTLTAVAERLGMNKGELSRIETGRVFPTSEELQAITEELGVPEAPYPILAYTGEEQVGTIPPPAPRPPRPARPPRGSRETHREGVLRLLREQGADGVTPLEALDQVGTYRLSARIMELRREGYNIETLTHRTPSGADVARYVLHDH